MPPRNARTAILSRRSRQEPATGKNFPKRAFAQRFAFRNRPGTSTDRPPLAADGRGRWHQKSRIPRMPYM
ncbi:hypothetical protein SGPA1_21134 [Streptomyces misionensis JCM 4497]